MRKAVADQLAQLAAVYRGEAETLKPWRWSAREGPLEAQKGAGAWIAG